MASKPTIRDSSITEHQLAPHLRRRIRTGASYSTLVDASPDTGTADNAVVAEYRAETAQSITMEPWDSAYIVLAATEALTPSDSVTDDDPWTYSSPDDVTVYIEASVTATCQAGPVTFSVMVGAREVGSIATYSTVAQSFRVTILSGEALTVRAWSHAISDLPVTVSVDEFMVRVAAL